MNRKAGRHHFGYAVLKYRPWLEAWQKERRTFTGVHYVMNKELLNYPLMARKIMEDKLPSVDVLMGDLTGEGVTDLILNAIRTQNDRRMESITTI